MDHKGSQILIDLELVAVMELGAEIELEAVAEIEAVAADEIFEEEDLVKVSAFQFHSVSQECYLGKSAYKMQ